MLSIQNVRRLSVPTVLVVLLLIGLLFGSATPASAAEDGQSDFTKGGYVVTEGDVTSVAVTVENTQTTEITLGSESVGYKSQFKLTDGNADGNVSFEFDSLAAGDGATSNTLSTSNSEDSISFVSGETVLSNPPLDTGVYDLTATVNGSETDISVITVLPRSTEGIAISGLPASAEPTSTQDIRAASADTSDIAVGDKFAVTIDASGLGQFLTDASVSDLEEGTSSSQAQGITVQMRETTAPLNQEPSQLAVSNGELFANPNNNTYSLVFDTSAYPDITSGQDFAVTLSFTDEFPYVDTDADAEEQTVSANGTFVEKQIQFDDYDDQSDAVTVPSASDTEISGTTTVAPGTQLTMRARSTGETKPFVSEKTTTVSETGRFATTLDIEQLSPGAEFTLTFDTFGTVDAAVELPTFDVDFTVTDDTGTQIEDVSIEVDGESSETSTSLKQGTHTIETSAPGYATSINSVKINNSTTVEVSLEESTYPVTATVVDKRGEVISNATVSVDGQTIQADDSVALQSGEYTFSASASDYNQSRTDFTVSASSTTVTLTLAQQPSESGQESPESDATNTTDTTDVTNATNTTSPTEDNSSGGIISRLLDFLPFF